MFKDRLVSGIFLILVALALIFSGGNILLLGLGVVSLLGLFELFRIVQIEKSPLGFFGYCGVIVYYFNLEYSIIKDPVLFILAYLILLLIVYVAAFPKYNGEQVFITFFGLFYVAVMLSCIYLTRTLEGGMYVVWLIFFCSWGSDTCAYCVGMLCGKHKLAPKLSPKKSIEGAIGGIVGTILLTAGYSHLFYHEMKISRQNILLLAGLCSIGAMISMIGDLAASGIKRNYKIKDFGAMIPGHGGILDRFDSVIITAPVVYYLLLNFK